AQWLRTNAPHNARVASFDAGVIGYFAPQSVTNLDGLVNSVAYLKARKAGHPLAAYLREQEIEYIVNVFPDAVEEWRLPGVLEATEGGEFAIAHRGGEVAQIDGVACRLFVLARQ